MAETTSSACTAPEWSKDEQSMNEAKEYLRQGNTVEFFEKVAASILREHPQDVIVFCYELIKSMKEGNDVKKEGEFAPKEQEDNQYMRSHNVSEFLDKWILGLLNVRPQTDEERLEFHWKYLEALVESGRAE
eukprot:Tbor_TRINITY_DN2318_c0_g1::TRINITY_DN2318_c0_g1_i1::g.131::m.131